MMNNPIKIVVENLKYGISVINQTYNIAIENLRYSISVEQVSGTFPAPSGGIGSMIIESTFTIT